MTIRRTFILSVSTLALSAGMASADLTGAQVWQDWKNYYEGFGYSATGTESQSGDTLTVSDAGMSIELPNDEGTMNVTFGSLQFVNNSDGTVSVILPEQVPMAFDIDPAQGEAVSGTVLVTNSNSKMVVSGDASALTYTYTADSMGMIMGDFTVEGANLPSDMMKVDLTVNNVSMVTRTTDGDLRDYSQSITADNVAYDFAVSPPESDGGGSAQFTGTWSGLKANAEGILPKNGDAADLNKMIEAGLDFAGTFAFDAGNGQFEASGPDGDVRGTTSSQGGTINMKMGANGLSYDVSQANTKVDLQVPQFPLPISLEMVTSAFNMAMPLRAGDDEQDFAFGFTMGDFTISDTIWGIFDPAGQLPRDPATLALDVTGKAKMTVDIFDPANAELLENGAPLGEFNAVNINNLTLSAVGANLTGSGAFTFDNSDMTTMPGMPRPDGAIDLRLQGANALIDTLVNMGFVQQEQAMGARMMMGMFGVPEGEDTLTSKIEVNEQGHVLANGQRIR